MCPRNNHVLSPKQTFQPLKFTNGHKCLCDHSYWNNSIVEHIFMPKCAVHNRPTTLHLVYVTIPLLQQPTKTKQINPWKLKIVHVLNWRVDASAQALFYMNIKKTSHLYQNKHLWCIVHAKFALEWQPMIGDNTLTWAPNTTKTWPLFTLTFKKKNTIIVSKF